MTTSPQTAETIEHFAVRNRYSGTVQFTAEISVTPDMTPSVKLGLAVKWGRKSDADLSGADLRGAPVIPDIHREVYEAASQPGALDMGDWHTCETTHCRAGWVVALAGEAGKGLEDKIGTPAAATLIYLASDPNLEKFPDFYCSNDAALADMARLAGVEPAQ